MTLLILGGDLNVLRSPQGVQDCTGMGRLGRQD